MSNEKTCGECRYYEHPAGQCAKVIEYNNCHITDKACEYFEPKVITKGDRIRSMSNEEFSNFLCKNLRAVIRKPEVVGDNYEQILLAWLNAPAACVGKDTDVPAEDALKAEVERLKEDLEIQKNLTRQACFEAQRAYAETDKWKKMLCDLIDKQAKVSTQINAPGTNVGTMEVEDEP